jgi:hypothetical protein
MRRRSASRAFSPPLRLAVLCSTVVAAEKEGRQEVEDLLVARAGDEIVDLVEYRAARVFLACSCS